LDHGLKEQAMTEAELAIVRRAYAKQIMLFNAAHPRAEAAFAVVRREAFLGPGPWPICTRGGHMTTPDDDPVYLYQNLLVGLIPERRLNNGQPSGHAMQMVQADPRPGEHTVHIGAGSATTRRSWRTWWARKGGSRQLSTIPASPRVWW
jgi:protein-L-isoaspartate(D-aspartate) O-methyltransferase